MMWCQFKVLFRSRSRIAHYIRLAFSHICITMCQLSQNMSTHVQIFRSMPLLINH